MSLTATLSKNDSNLSIVNKNYIINGGFKVDQRNAYASKTIVAAAALAYTADRWYALCTGANVTGQVVAGSNQTQKRYQFTGAGSVTAISFGTRLEVKDTYGLNNQTVTLSVDLANSSLTSVTWTLNRPSASDDTFGSITQIATGTFTVNSTVTRYSTQISVPSTAVNGLELILSVGAQGAASTWTIGNVKLELGAVATPYESRAYAEELALCQRYYYKSFPNVNAAQIVPSTYSFSTTVAHGTSVFPVPLRVAPTALEQSGTITDYRIQHGATTSPCATSVPVFNSANTLMAKTDFTTTAVLTVGQAGNIIAAAASSAGYVAWSAEL